MKFGANKRPVEVIQEGSDCMLLLSHVCVSE